jgi:hypothetical protein
MQRGVVFGRGDVMRGGRYFEHVHDSPNRMVRVFK